MENLITDKIELTIHLIGEKRGTGGIIKARERIVMKNGDVVYKDWEAYPYFLRVKRTSNLLDDFTRHVSLLKEAQPAKDGSGDSGNFISLLKMIRVKLLLKVINFIH